MNGEATLDAMLRRIVGDTVREVIRNELSALTGEHPVRNGNAVTDTYLSVAKAAKFADVVPGTIRVWIRTGRLASKRAGRVLRVSRADLERFMSGIERDDLASIRRRADSIGERSKARAA